MTDSSSARRPFSREAFDAHLNHLGTTPLKVVVPDEERQLVRLLMEPGLNPARVGTELRARFDRKFLVVRDGSPLDVASQILSFMREDVKFMVQDAFGLMAYVTDTHEAQSKARGTRFLNVATFNTFTGGHLSILPASDAYREMLRSAFRARARGYRDIPGEDVDALVAAQRGVITREELLAALDVTNEDFSWMLLPEGPERGSYDFRIPFLGRGEDMLYGMIEARLRRLAPMFGLEVQRVDRIAYARKYFLSGDSGSVTLKVYNAPARLKGMSHVVPENARLMAASTKLLPPLLAILHAQVR